VHSEHIKTSALATFEKKSKSRICVIHNVPGTWPNMSVKEVFFEEIIVELQSDFFKKIGDSFPRRQDSLCKASNRNHYRRK
jgi:hypothetical protein